MNKIPAAFDARYVFVLFSAEMLKNIAANVIPNLMFFLANVLLRSLLTKFMVRFFGSRCTYCGLIVNSQARNSVRGTNAAEIMLAVMKIRVVV